MLHVNRKKNLHASLAKHLFPHPHSHAFIFPHLHQKRPAHHPSGQTLIVIIRAISPMIIQNIHFSVRMIPPAVNVSVALAFLHRLLEIPLQHLATICLIVTLHNLSQFIISVRLYEIIVFVDKTEPELQEQVVHRIHDILVGRFLKHRLILGYQSVVVLQPGHIAAHFRMQNALYVTSRIVARRYQFQYIKVAAVISRNYLISYSLSKNIIIVYLQSLSTTVAFYNRIELHSSELYVSVAKLSFFPLITKKYQVFI